MRKEGKVPSMTTPPSTPTSSSPSGLSANLARITPRPSKAKIIAPSAGQYEKQPSNPEPMHTITLTQEELEAATDALDTTLIEFEMEDYLTDTARYETLKALYTKLLNRQFII